MEKVKYLIELILCLSIVGCQQPQIKHKSKKINHDSAIIASTAIAKSYIDQSLLFDTFKSPNAAILYDSALDLIDRLYEGDSCKSNQFTSVISRKNAILERFSWKSDTLIMHIGFYDEYGHRMNKIYCGNLEIIESIACDVPRKRLLLFSYDNGTALFPEGLLHYDVHKQLKRR